GTVADRETLLRFEPLAIALDERDAGERNAKDTLRHTADLVEALFGCAIDRGAEPELYQTLRFVLRDERTHHFLGLRPEPAAPHHCRNASAKSPRVNGLVQHIVDTLREQIVRLALRTRGRDNDDRDIDEYD